MKLDRTYQLDLLNKLSACYPQRLDNREETCAFDAESEAKYVANMIYLEQSGLIDSGLGFCANGDAMIKTLPKINNKGMDILADDGGLSAILGVVTVKIHADSIRELIGNKIEQSDLQPEEKNKLLAAVRDIPAASIKYVAERLIGSALDNAPDLIGLLSKCLA